MTFESYELWIALGVALAVLVPGGLYTWSVYNELTARWERLHSLLATAQLMKNRRRSIGGAVRAHVLRSGRHVENTVRHAARGKRGGRQIKVTMDGYPEQRVVEVTNRGLSDDVRSRDMETDAQVALREAAAEYNSRLRSFPCCLVAQWLGFRPWKTHGSSKRRRGRWRPREIWRHRRP